MTSLALRSLIALGVVLGALVLGDLAQPPRLVAHVQEHAR